MPIYLVRWPTLSASLVRARDEAELMYLLDQVDDPGSCTYEVYRGPLWIDFELPFEIRGDSADEKGVVDLSKLTVDPAEGFANLDFILAPNLPYADETMRMRDAILRRAFPRLAAYVKEVEGNESSGPSAEASPRACEPPWSPSSSATSASFWIRPPPSPIRGPRPTQCWKRRSRRSP